MSDLYFDKRCQSSRQQFDSWTRTQKKPKKTRRKASKIQDTIKQSVFVDFVLKSNKLDNYMSNRMTLKFTTFPREIKYSWISKSIL